MVSCFPCGFILSITRVWCALFSACTFFLTGKPEGNNGIWRTTQGICRTPNLPTNIVDFRGFDSSIMLILKKGILMSIGNLPESLSQAMLVLVGIMLVGRLGVQGICRTIEGRSLPLTPTRPVRGDLYCSAPCMYNLLR